MRPNRPRKDLARDLDQHSLGDPGFEVGKAVLQELVALGMGDDGTHVRPHQAREDLVGRLGNVEVGKLDQQVAFVIDRVLMGGVDRIVDVLRGEMEVAAVVDAGRVADGGLEFADFAAPPRGDRKRTSGSRAGYATISVVPAAAAIRTMAMESSRVLAPSSIPGRMWL